jgi:hypothetical protein
VTCTRSTTLGLRPHAESQACAYVPCRPSDTETNPPRPDQPLGVLSCSAPLACPFESSAEPPPYAMSATAMTIGSETTEATEVTIVRVLKVPWVDSPSSDLYIQKKLLLT